MDLNENGSLAVLEHFLEEFFNPATSNVRKHEIETQLQSFKTTPHLGKLCLYFVQHTSSQYVTMFALSALESVISQQWANLDWSFKEEMKNVLHNYLIEQGNTSPYFIRSKYAKLLVDIAKQDWPSRYPNFFNNILELLKSEPNQLIGLLLLRTTSEEFMGLNAVLENGRKFEISALFESYIPIVFDLLSNILENLLTKPRHTSTATPPPSPTHPTSAPNLTHQLTAVTFRQDSKALNKEALATIQHLFSWVPINQIPSAIIKSIFSFTNISTYAQDDDDMCVLAMSTINELLYRKCTPPGRQELFLQLYHHTIELMLDIRTSSNYRIESLDPAFVEKLAELLVLLIEQHLWRLEVEPSFSALEFLSLLFQLTMQLPSVPCYLRCLGVWAAFIKQIKPHNAHKYAEVYRSLVSSVLRKFQFTFNSHQLNSINHVDVDDDNESEWQVFVKKSVEMVAMIGEYNPFETFNQVILQWKVTYDVFKHLESGVDQRNYTLIYDTSETERLCYALKDFSTLTQTLARLSSLFVDQENEDMNSNSEALIGTLVEKLLESASIATSIRFYNLKMGESRLAECFIDIHSHLLASLKTWLLWMSQNSKLSNDNIETIVNITLPLLHDGALVPSKISHAAGHLLLTFTSVVFAPHLIVLPVVVQFIHVVPTLKFSDMQTSYIVTSAISNLLLRPWGDLSQDDSNHRNVLIHAFFDNLTKDFRELTGQTNERRVSEVVDSVLPSLSHIIEFCKNFPINSKKMLCAAIKPTIEHALLLFPVYVKYPDVGSNVLLLFLNVLGALQQQLGVESTKNAVQVFLQVAVSEQQVNNLTGLDKLLKILQFVVEAPGNSYKTFLPSILQLCMENVYPLIITQANDHPDVFIALLTLLFSVLLHRWQYFYMSQVRLGYSPGCSESDTGPDSPQQPEQLLAILQVFGQALLQNDINIFRLSLAALEDLNGKWKLYHKSLFREQLLARFLTVLLQTLIDKSQDLLADDIQIAVYNMASVNFDGFYLTFLHQFIQGMDSVAPEQCQILLENFGRNQDKDMPTFVQHLQRFVNESRHFRLCNVTSSNL